MLILIPIDKEDALQSKVAGLLESNKWALVEFDDGTTKSIRFLDDRAQSGEDWIDFIILKNKFENYMSFMEEGMMVLVVRQEESIEEILEAFKFKELDEIGL